MLENLTSLKQRAKYYILVPIVLASVTHLWNPTGFPPLHPDEADYMTKAMYVLAGYGPQLDSPLATNQIYTHPHFGQLFLAATLAITGYPHTLVPQPSIQSIESIYAVPRFIMGLLAVLDTFVLFHIAKRRYDGTVALIASSLFAVLPLTLILRQIFLDNILLPFLLLSLLFAIYLTPGEKVVNGRMSKNRRWYNNNRLLILLSGIFLGIAIYTKIPSFTMIPVIGYLVFINSNKRFKNLALWLIPVIIIPCLWPAYALFVGQIDLWIDGITAQGTRHTQGQNKLISSLNNIFKIDPLFSVLGSAGLVYAVLRKEYWILLWVVPLLVFSYFIGWAVYFHLVPLFPAFCICCAVLMTRIFNSNIWRRLISPVLISGSICFGLVVSVLLITLNVNSYQFEPQAYIVKKLMKKIQKNDDNNSTAFVGHRMYSWIPKYIFQASFDTFPADPLPLRWNESKIIFVDNGNESCCTELRSAAKLKLSSKKPSLPEYYPFTGIIFNPSIGKKVVVRVWSPR